jgi:hypothetical protein
MARKPLPSPMPERKCSIYHQRMQPLRIVQRALHDEAVAASISSVDGLFRERAVLEQINHENPKHTREHYLTESKL